MTGADIVLAVLRDAPSVMAAVPAGRTQVGRLPDNVGLPALLVRTISVIDRQPLRRGAMVRSVERVAVTVRAANYRDQGAIMKLVRTACGGWLGDKGDAQRVSILTAGTGPDVDGPGNSYEQTQDFRASYDAPA